MWAKNQVACPDPKVCEQASGKATRKERGKLSPRRLAWLRDGEDIERTNVFTPRQYTEKSQDLKGFEEQPSSYCQLFPWRGRACLSSSNLGWPCHHKHSRSGVLWLPRWSLNRAKAFALAHLESPLSIQPHAMRSPTMRGGHPVEKASTPSWHGPFYMPTWLGHRPRYFIKQKSRWFLRVFLDEINI